MATADIDGKPGQRATEELVARVLEFIRKHEPVRAGVISTSLRISGGCVHHAVQILEARHQVAFRFTTPNGAAGKNGRRHGHYYIPRAKDEAPMMTNGHNNHAPPTAAPPKTITAALVYGSYDLLERNKTVDKLSARGVVVKKQFAMVLSGARHDFSTVELVLYVVDQLNNAAQSSVRDQARLQGKPCFALHHAVSHDTWRALQKFLDDRGVRARTLEDSHAAPVPALPAAIKPVETPPVVEALKEMMGVAPPKNGLAAKVARSIEESEQLAAMYEQESAQLKKELDELRRSTSAQARDQLMSDIARKEKERIEARHELERTRTELEARLAAAEAERREEVSAARHKVSAAENQLRVVTEQRDQLAAELRRLKDEGDPKLLEQLRTLESALEDVRKRARDFEAEAKRLRAVQTINATVTPDNAKLIAQLASAEAEVSRLTDQIAILSRPVAHESESAWLKKIRWAVGSKQDGMLDIEQAFEIIAKAVRP